MTLQSGAFARPRDPVQFLRGDWIDRRRAVVGLWVCLAAQAAFALNLYWGAQPPFDAAGRLLGSDFSALWAAGRQGLAGDWVSSYDLARFGGHLREAFGSAAPNLVWAYPPLFYFIVGPLAALPYTLALLVWLGASFSALAAAVWRIAPSGLALLAIFAFPGLIGNAIHGQTAFFTAALFAAALLALPRHPLLAGALIACLAYKPQYGLLIPLALAAGGHWRAFASAAFWVLALFAASALAFGWESWAGFFGSLHEMQAQSLERGRNGYHNLVSAFAALRQAGAPLALAWAGQGVVAAFIAGATIWLWRSGADHRLKAAGLIAGALLFTPYCLDYDLALLGPVIALLVAFGRERGFLPWSHSVLALAFIAPPLARYVAFFGGFPLGLFAAMSLFLLALAHARSNDLAGGHLARNPAASPAS